MRNWLHGKSQRQGSPGVFPEALGVGGSRRGVARATQLRAEPGTFCCLCLPDAFVQPEMPWELDALPVSQVEELVGRVALSSFEWKLL